MMNKSKFKDVVWDFVHLNTSFELEKAELARLKALKRPTPAQRIRIGQIEFRLLNMAGNIDNYARDIFDAYNKLYDIAQSPDRNGHVILEELKEWIEERESE